MILTDAAFNVIAFLWNHLPLDRSFAKPQRSKICVFNVCLKKKAEYITLPCHLINLTKQHEHNLVGDWSSRRGDYYHYYFYEIDLLFATYPSNLSITTMISTLESVNPNWNNADQNLTSGYREKELIYWILRDVFRGNESVEGIIGLWSHWAHWLLLV